MSSVRFLSTAGNNVCMYSYISWRTGIGKETAAAVELVTCKAGSLASVRQREQGGNANPIFGPPTLPRGAVTGEPSRALAPETNSYTYIPAF